MDNLPSPEQRRAAYRAWIESFGFSDEDRRRIRMLAEEVTPHVEPAALDDLSVPYRVGAGLAERARWMGGKTLGTLTRRDGVRIVLRYWTITRGMEWERWERRRRGGR